jgi:hypothetical protein
MPFTLVHPAIVLPLKYLPRRWVSMTGLIVGSLMPDSESFIRMYAEKGITHSWRGFFYFGLPLGVVFSYVFHNVVKGPLIANLPSFLRKRFSHYSQVDWNKNFLNDWHIFLLSMIVGAASHFFWDSFSEPDEWFLNTFATLKGNIFISGRSVEIPYLIQYINTAIGLVIITLFVAKMRPDKTKESGKGSVSFKIWVILLAIGIYSVRIIYMPVNSVDDLIIAAVASLLLAVLIMAYIYHENSSKILLTLIPLLFISGYF